MSHALNADFLHALAFNKRNPEFTKAATKLAAAHQHAVSMFDAGRLSKSEYHDLEAVLFSELIDALPVETFQEMMADGRLEQLQALAGHDGTRGAGEVDAARAAVAKKVNHDFLDAAWLEQRIDSATYADALAQLERPGERGELHDRLAEGDFDGAASEEFARRHDVGTGPENDLSKWIKDKYGEGPKKAEKPPFEVIRETVVDVAGTGAGAPSFEGIIDLDAPEEEQS